MSLRDDLIRDEGLRLRPYRDQVGKLTVGVGRNLDDVGISEDEAYRMLDNDIARVEAALDRQISWWRSRSQPCQDSLANMAFQLGIAGLLEFSRMLSCLHAGDYDGAASEARASKWYTQVPARAERVIAGFRG